MNIVKLRFSKMLKHSLNMCKHAKLKITLRKFLLKLKNNIILFYNILWIPILILINVNLLVLKLITTFINQSLV